MSTVRDYVDAELAAMLPASEPVRLPDYGEDWSGLTGITEWRIVRKAELLKQQAYRRITTRTGSYFGEPWGIDIQEFLHSKLSDAEMAGRVQVELLRDARLQSVTCVVVRLAEGLRFDVLLVPRDLEAAGVPLSMVAFVDRTGVTNV